MYVFLVRVLGFVYVLRVLGLVFDRTEFVLVLTLLLLLILETLRRVEIPLLVFAVKFLLDVLYLLVLFAR